MTAGPVRLSIWSDYVCPFCYLELPLLDQLNAELGDRVAVDWRAFELRPDPVPTLDPDAPYLHRVWSQSVYPMAEARGMTLRLPPVQPRSRKALEAAEFARSVGLDPDRLGGALAEGRHAAGVLEEERAAANIGITGVPAMLLSRPGGGGRAYLLSGALPDAALAEAVDRALTESGG